MAKFTDGTTISVGSLELTINAVTYVAEDFTLSFGSERIELMDEDGEPTQACLYENTPNGSATLQAAASTTVKPEVGDEFVVASGDATGTWVIDSVGPTLGQRAFRKFSITFNKKINVA